jgi:hypothetical protein
LVPQVRALAQAEEAGKELAEPVEALAERVGLAAVRQID